MPSLRFTEEQFDDGASADGSRIDRALVDLRNAWNRIAARHVRRRHLPVVVAGGYRPHGPSPSTPADPFPFVGSANTAARIVGGTTPSNPHRSRGTSQSGIDTLSDLGMLYGWEIPFAFPDGGIFDGVSYYTGALAWPAAPIPPGKVAGESVDDVSIELQIASPALPMKRSMSAQEMLKRGFKLSTFRINNYSVVASPDFYPSQTGTTTPFGAMIHAQDLNIPIPVGAVARLVFTLPSYAGTGYNSAWGDKPWWSHTSWTASLLLPLRR